MTTVLTLGTILGGVGLFLLGMSLLTEGLKSFAGDSLRDALIQFTGTPTKSFLSGTAATLLLQSSSATIITVIGFVSAGLLTFPQALGVVFGASLGTTGTSWLVAVLGLKIKIGTLSLPLIGIGAFLRMLARGRWKSLGTSLAGFALIFVGIDFLQAGMAELAGLIQLAALPAHGLIGHAVSMVIGAVMTIVMQSSSAAVATTLTALGSKAINFEQAASLVIGASVGTTVTGALAAIDASTSAKRTAIAHILFNLATGLIALLLLPLLLWGIDWAQQAFGWEDDAVSLAAFHTTFIALGVLLFLPFVHRFAESIEKLVPESGPRLTRHLDRSLREAPSVGFVATKRALQEIGIEMFRSLEVSLKIQRWHSRTQLIQQALEETQQFLESLPVTTEDESLIRTRIEQLHAIDHLWRLYPRLTPSQAIRNMLEDQLLQAEVEACRKIVADGRQVLEGKDPGQLLSEMELQARNLARHRLDQRPIVIQQTAIGRRKPVEALPLLDSYRWLDRVGHHVWRTAVYLAEIPPVQPEVPPELRDTVIMEAVPEATASDEASPAAPPEAPGDSDSPPIQG